MFVGSSIIRLWSTIGNDMPPYNVIQRGYGGAKLSDLVVYADRIIYPHLSQAIVIFIGNDISGSDNDKSSAGSLAAVQENTIYNPQKISDTPVFWISITPTPARWNVWPRDKGSGRDDQGYLLETPEYLLYRYRTIFS